MDLDNIRSELIRTIFKMRKINLSVLFDGISRSEFFVIEILTQEKEKEETAKVYVSDLAVMMETAPSAVSRLLRGMEEKGLVIREVDVTDRRNTYVLLTDTGALKRQIAIQRLNTFFNRVISRMGEEEVYQMLNLWNQLSDAMADELDQMTKGDLNDKPIEISK